MAKPKSLAGWDPAPEFAKKTGKSERTLREDRRLGRGAAWAKWGNRVYYRTDAGERYLESQEVSPVRSEAKPARSRSRHTRQGADHTGSHLA
jgi:hypothetical protein